MLKALKQDKITKPLYSMNGRTRCKEIPDTEKNRRG